MNNEIQDLLEASYNQGEVDDLDREIQEHLAEGQKLQEEVKSELNIADLRDQMLCQLIESRKAAELAGNGKAIILLDNLIWQHKQAKSLEFMLTGSNKRVNKLKRKDYTTVMRTAREKLGINKKYTFPDLKGLNENLFNALPEGYKEYSMAFLIRLYSFITKQPLEKNAIMIGQILNNLKALGRETDHSYIGEWKLRVMHVIDNITGKYED
jgi:hypothetical protein